MCGVELPASSYAHRFGALAIMSSPVLPSSSVASSTSSSPTVSREVSPDSSSLLSGSVAFFNDTDHDCQVATHVQFSPSVPLPAGGCSSLLLNIHDFGGVYLDMTTALVTSRQHCGPFLQRLREPLHLHVGEDRHGNRGIIGHRVTMYRIPQTPSDQTSAMVVSEGIVGFNSLPRTGAS